jgi:Tol biopolymer transport system component
MKTIIKTTVILATLVYSATTLAQVNPQWVRYPVISPNGQTIAFTYKGDLYRVDTAGGQATRLTFHKAHDFNAVWSEDGQSLAFASDRHGNFDVFIMDANGGEATRLSYDSSNEIPYSFSENDSRVLFKGQRMDLATHRQYPSSRLPELYSVAVTGDRVKQVFTLTAEHVQVSEDGKQYVYQDSKGAENEWRKYHKSSATRDIWTYDLKSGKHKQITTFEGEDRNPIYASDNKSIYYLSEQSGSFNVHKLNLNRPSRQQQLTEFTKHPVRFLSAGNNNGQEILAFSHHGILHTMVPGEKAKKVDVTIRTQDVSNNEELISIAGEISEMQTSPNGKEIAFIANGEVFVASADGKFVKQITKTPAQERFVSFSPDGDYLVYAAARGNNWSIYKATKVKTAEPFFYAASLIQESSLIDNKVDNYQPKLSPDGKKLAFIEDRRSLKVMTLDDNNIVTLVPASDMIHMRDGDQTFSWSPDSEWLLFEDKKLLNNADIALVHASGNDSKKVLVPSGYYDAEPKWVNEGKQIIWFSNRLGMRSYATSGRSQYDVYSMFFNQDVWDEFNLSEQDYELSQAIEEAAKEAEKEAKKAKDDADGDDNAEGGEKKDEITKLEIQWEGIEDRTSRLTIHSSILSDAVLNKDASKLYYLAQFEDNYDLWETDLRTNETKKAISLNVRNGSLQWDAKHENLYLLAQGKISTLDVDGGASKGINISEQMVRDQNALMQHSFDHVWLRTSKIFYEPTFHGVDWPDMRSEYKPKVAHLGNGREFAELLSEMLGELNVSHSGAGFRGQSGNGDDTASLGIFYDFEHAGDGIKITEIVKGGPLDKAKFDVKAGMLITHIDGVLITPSFDWAKLLNRKAGKFILLTLQDTISKETSDITIKAVSLDDLGPLLYQRFVKTNEKEVLERSNGQLGYVHIPGMGDGPFRSIFDDMMGKHFDKKGMVVDTRFNGGGDLVADLAMFFTGERFLSYEIEGKVVGGEPTSRYTKPIITLFNESMYSDGHCYASGYADLKLGKSVGMPVPGTCSFAGWERLPTGGFWGVVPVSAKNKAGEWLENNQTPPDILIKNQPGVIDFGTDQQLERAIEELMRDVD